MRVRNVLFLLSALTLGLGAQVTTAQDRLNFTVDGDWQDWNYVSALDWPYDVIPDTNRTVDIRRYAYGWGDFGPHDKPRRELFAFIFRFADPPFQGSDPTTVDLYFDVSTDANFGDLTAPWQYFRPEYRFTVTGQGGRLTTETYRRYTGGQWNAPTEGTDISELETALAGNWLEGAIPWSALGSPAPPEDPTESLAFRWAVQVSQGSYREYVPDETDSWSPITDYLTTIEAQSWGGLKSMHD